MFRTGRTLDHAINRDEVPGFRGITLWAAQLLEGLASAWRSPLTSIHL